MQDSNSAPPKLISRLKLRNYFKAYPGKQLILYCWPEMIKASLTTSVSSASSSSEAVFSPPSQGSRSFSLCSPLTLALMAESVKASATQWGGLGPVRPVWVSLHTGFELRNSSNTAESQAQHHHCPSPGAAERGDYSRLKYRLTSPISENRIIFSYFKMFSTITCIFGREKEKKRQHKDPYSSRKPKTCIKFFSNQPTQLCANIKKAGKQLPKWAKCNFPFKYPNFFCFHNSSTHQQGNYPSAWCSHFL